MEQEVNVSKLEIETLVPSQELIVPSIEIMVIVIIKITHIISSLVYPLRLDPLDPHLKRQPSLLTLHCFISKGGVASSIATIYSDISPISKWMSILNNYTLVRHSSNS
ncbi:hypothetical protein V1478_015574 [Vespula squamosa]|uniref:Uncharacterized protein n=1 Tax=Vespula squamosa TaxID=30214 RepID=A0ABD2A174_VESSQ